MKNVGFGAAFILEIIAFISFACLGFILPITHTLQIVSSIMLFLALTVFWGLYMSPKAPKKFNVAAYYVSKLLIYSLAAFVIFRTQQQILGLLFVSAVIVDELLLFKHNTLEHK